MLRFTLVAAAVAAVLASPLALAQQGSFVVRARATTIVPADKSDPIPALSVPADAIDVSNKTIPEVDFVYFFTPNIAGELVLTVPQRHDVSIKGVGKIGTFKHLPPTALIQYHFLPGGTIDPYLGAGVNYTRISSVNLAVPGAGALDLEKSSIGAAVQAGLDFSLDRNWLVNLDVKWVQIQSDVKVKASGAVVSKVKVDPILWSVGIGYRF